MFWNTSGFDCAGTCADDIPNPGYTYPRALILAVLWYLRHILSQRSLGWHTYQRRRRDGWNVCGRRRCRWRGDVRRLVRVYRGYKCDWDVMHVVVHDVETVSRDVHYWIISEDIQRERHPVYGTPHYAIYATSALSLVFTGFNFAILAEADMLFYCSSTILKFGALVSLRWQMPYAERPFSIPFGNLGLFGVAIPPTLACLSVVLTCRGSCLQIGIPGMLLGVITYYAKGGVRAVENMIPFDEDEDNKGGVTVDRSKEGEDLPLRVFTLDDNNSDAGDAKNAHARENPLAQTASDRTQRSLRFG